jgi:hypothetical protein
VDAHVAEVVTERLLHAGTGLFGQGLAADLRRLHLAQGSLLVLGITAAALCLWRDETLDEGVAHRLLQGREHLAAQSHAAGVAIRQRW